MSIYTHTKSLSTRWTDFLSKANLKFTNRFDYSKSVYVNAHTPITISCPTHGAFQMIPWVHLSSTTGCPSCSQTNFTTSRRFNKEDFIRRCTEVHGNKFDYSEVEYKNMKSNVIITCPTHGKFTINAWQHLQSKHGCVQCGYANIGTLLSLTKEEFISRAISVHGDRYDYSDVMFKNGSEKVTIKCHKHGSFKKQVQSHLGGSGCPKCQFSKGEDTIRKVLEERHILYVAQHSFPDCKRIRCLKFDYYCPDINLAIEYDGEGHFMPIKTYDIEKGMKLLQYAQENDEIKNQYCMTNNIKLLRITYHQKMYIPDILNSVLNELQIK